jgi:hypothetical protein
MIQKVCTCAPLRCASRLSNTWINGLADVTSFTDPRGSPGDQRLRNFFFALFDAIDRFEATSFRRDCFAPYLQPSMIADVRGRVIDVSLNAARALGMMRSGVVRVSVQ